MDTCILVYAYYPQPEEKHDVARRIVEEVWESGRGVLSTQVLQEFYVTLVKKLPRPSGKREALVILEELASTWPVSLITPQTVIHAAKLSARYQLALWDSLLVACAAKEDAQILLTEDLNHGQVIEGVRIENPFVAVG